MYSKLICFWCLLVPVMVTAQTGLSLEDAVQLAYQKQYAIRSSILESEQSGNRLFEAQTRFMPKLNGSFDARNNVQRQVILLPTSAFGGPEGQFKELRQGTQYNATAAVDLTQPILDLSGLSEIKWNKENRKLTDLLGEQIRIEIKAMVHRAYYNVLLNQQREKRAEKNAERNREALKVVKSRYENQNALKSDLNRAKLNLSNAEFQLKVLSDSVETSMSYLSFLLGADRDTKFSLTDSLKMNAAQEAGFDAGNGENRIEIQAAAQVSRLTEQQIKRIQMGYVPTMNAYGFFAGQSFSANANVFQKDKWFSVGYLGVKLNVPIFDGMQKSAQIRQQKVLYQKQQIALDSTKAAVLYQIESATRAYRNAMVNLEIQKSNLSLAEEIVSEVNSRYQNEFALYSDLLDAENTYRETELNYFQSLYNFLISEIEWKKARGKF